MIVTGLLLALLLTASVTDIWRHKIYNWTTYPGILIALGLNIMGSILEETREPNDWLHDLVGWVGWERSLFGFGACGVVMLICLALFQIGGGDVKLVAMLGAFLGLEQGVAAMLWMFVLGGCAGLIVLVWRVGFVALVTKSFRHASAMLRVGGAIPLNAEDRALLKSRLYLAPMAVVAVIVVRFSLVDYVL